MEGSFDLTKNNFVERLAAELNEFRKANKNVWQKTTVEIQKDTSCESTITKPFFLHHPCTSL